MAGGWAQRAWVPEQRECSMSASKQAARPLSIRPYIDGFRSQHRPTRPYMMGLARGDSIRPYINGKRFALAPLQWVSLTTNDSPRPSCLPAKMSLSGAPCRRDSHAFDTAPSCLPAKIDDSPGQ